MKKTVKRTDADIKKIILKHGGETTTMMFRKLSKVGGNGFRKAMTRAKRIAKSIVVSEA